MALKLDILANTRSLVSEMKKGGASVDDVSDALDDLAREGEKSGDKLEQTFRELAKDAEKADKATEKIGDGAKSGFGKAGDSASEFKSEALSNFSEITSSFDGSMESIGELAQGTLGGVAANLPGIGLAAGVAAIGIGGITSELTRASEESARIKQSILDDFLELGDALNKEAVDARVRDILGTENTRKQAEALAQILDINVGQAALALAGDYESAGVKVEEVINGINTTTENIEIQTWQELKESVKATNEAMDAGKQAAEAQADAVNRTASRMDADLETAKLAVDEVRYAFDLLTGNKEVKLRVDDTDLRNYRPPIITIPTKLGNPNIAGGLQLLG